jgi:hypothetical protein
MISSSRRITNAVLAITVAASLLTTAVLTATGLSQSVFAQQPQPPTQQQQAKAPLNFYLKLANNASTAQAASQAAANGTGTKNMTIAVNVQKGPSGQQIALPISAIVPANIQPQDLQLCASLADGSESCQPLSGGQQGASIDLSQSSATTAPPTATTSPMPAPPPTVAMTPAPVPQSYPENSNGKGTANSGFFEPIVDTMTSVFGIQWAHAQLIGINNTTVNIPVTVIVPINIQIQNAQICASVLSSGSQSCQQIVLDPTQTTYSPVNVDLTQPTPAVTTLAAPTTTPTAIPTPTSTTTPSPMPATTTTPAPATTPTPEPASPAPTGMPSTTTPETPEQAPEITDEEQQPSEQSGEGTTGTEESGGSTDSSSGGN